jgi:rare lipoprotein A
MRSKTLLLLVFILALAGSFNKVAFAQETPITDSVTFGRASFYHDKFNGRKTSSGELFSQEKLTAAHKNLPLGTYVKVTNLKNRESVVVKINDRLPPHSKRTIDLSKSAAKELKMIRSGLAHVSLEIVKK